MGLGVAGNGGDALDARANGAAVRLDADALDLDPVVVEARVSAHELRQAVHGVDDEIDIAVVVVVAEGAATVGVRNGDARSAILCDFAEAAVVQITVEQFLLGIAGLGGELFDFGIDVAVADEDVGPAVVIEVEPTASPTQVLRVQAEAGLEGGVLEVPAAHVAVERWGVAGEVGFENVEIAVAVEVGGAYAEAVGSADLGDAGLFGDVGECSVAVVVIEDVGVAVQSRRAAGH